MTGAPGLAGFEYPALGAFTDGLQTSRTVQCPVVKVTLSGGFSVLSQGGHTVVESYPSNNGSVWTVTVVDTNVPSISVDVTVTAICVNVAQ